METFFLLEAALVIMVAINTGDFLPNLRDALQAQNTHKVHCNLHQNTQPPTSREKERVEGTMPGCDLPATRASTGIIHCAEIVGG